MTRAEIKHEVWRLHDRKVPYKVMAQRLGLTMNQLSHFLTGKKKRPYRKTKAFFAQRRRVGMVVRARQFIKPLYDTKQADQELERQIGLAQREAATAPLYRPTLKNLGF